MDRTWYLVVPLWRKEWLTLFELVVTRWLALQNCFQPIGIFMVSRWMGITGNKWNMGMFLVVLRPCQYMVDIAGNEEQPKDTCYCPKYYMYKLSMVCVIKEHISNTHSYKQICHRYFYPSGYPTCLGRYCDVSNWI